MPMIFLREPVTVSFELRLSGKPSVMNSSSMVMKNSTNSPDFIGSSYHFSPLSLV